MNFRFGHKFGDSEGRTNLTNSLRFEWFVQLLLYDVDGWFQYEQYALKWCFILTYLFVAVRKYSSLLWKCLPLLSCTEFELWRACIEHMVGFSFSTYTCDDTEGRHWLDRRYQRNYFWCDNLFFSATWHRGHDRHVRLIILSGKTAFQEFISAAQGMRNLRKIN